MSCTDKIITWNNEFNSYDGTSIFDIIYNAFNNHNDVVLGYDAIVSQFFSIFGKCEQEHVFGEAEIKEKIMVEVDDKMTSQQLNELPKGFLNKLNLQVYGLGKYTNLLKNVMSKANISSHIFALSSMSNRFDYVAYTFCKNPDIKIDASQSIVSHFIDLMKIFINLPVSKSTQNYEALKFYLVLITKIYEKQYLGKCDANFFHNLIQKNAGSGAPVSGHIEKLATVSHTCKLNVKRFCATIRYPDLVYYSKIITRHNNENNTLYLDTMHLCPKEDTTNSHPIKHTSDKTNVHPIKHASNQIRLNPSRTTQTLSNEKNNDCGLM
ncbi:hypothetical protein BMW23_0674 [Bodo saltans virus]|uniref:Uncharacterized protein n=1 Tax=Bodo saltans virus TaxID=2024608 RepID=A0A2H4UUX3_9VIRU|nr:hypothetical protein QJ851_gp0657 [Bodo saltans virus]ATZ80720.1 hypothetical protein BMW23_0674 [Bodo saltans virus]